MSDNCTSQAVQTFADLISGGVQVQTLTTKLPAIAEKYKNYESTIRIALDHARIQKPLPASFFEEALAFDPLSHEHQ